VSETNPTSHLGVNAEAAAHDDQPKRPAISRRDALQWVMAAVAAASAPEHLFAQATKPQDVRQPEAARQPNPTPGGYGLDPNLLKIYKPGAVWPLTFNNEQKRTATALADVILPKDHYGPAASEVGVMEMIDEWISAPYPSQQADRPVILDGLAWIEAESQKRFGKSFADLSGGQHRAICDDICYTHEAKPPFKQAADFFSRFRSIAAGAYYATPPGWEAIGYVGNVALPKFDGPPPEVLARLGVEQTVK
jgi:hypothetical protein